MDFRYLVETKNEFNNFVSDILVPHIYNGIKGMFKYSENVYSQLEEKRKRGSSINNPGIVVIFKKTLEGISGLNNHEIEEEYIRIKNNSGFVEWFDSLIKASFKSYVLFLTWDPKTSQSKYSDNKLYDSIVIKDYIHKCYIMSCNYFRDYPELFLNNYRTNKKEIFNIIKKCLEIAMKKSLPYNDIIEEYLSIDFTQKDNNTEEITKIKNLVNNMINDNKYGQKPNIKKIFTEESYEVNNNNISKKEELENFINLELINQNNSKNEQITDLGRNNEIRHNSTNNSTNNISNTSNVLTRSTVKSKEFDNIIEEASRKSILEEDSLTSKTSEGEINNDITSEDEKNIILTSPPIIKKKVIDRLVDEIPGNVLRNKKNIEVVLNKDNIPDNFNKIEEYYDNLLK
jgi:hypothetical protein